MNEYQELGPQKINLVDMMFFCLEKWRWIIVSMLIFAIIAGSYKYVAVSKTNQSIQQTSVATEEDSEDVKTRTAQKSASEYYEQTIEDVKSYLDLQEDYLNNSIVMQLNPYHLLTGTLTYRLECEGDVGSLLTAYSSFVSGGGVAERLYSSGADISVEDLQYLIKFESNMLYSLELGDLKTIMKSDIFQIQIRLPEDESCEEYLNHMEELMSEYALKLQTEVGAHKLILLDSVQSEMSDTDLQTYQEGRRSAYVTSTQSLYTLRSQLDAILNTAETKTVEKVVENTSELVQYAVNPISSALQYAAAGLVLGAGLAVFLLIIIYIMSGKLQNVKEFHMEFEMPLLGMVRDPEVEQKKFRFIDNWIFQLKEGSYAKIGFEEQIKMAAANVETAISRNSINENQQRVMLAGTIAEKDMAVLCKQLTSELQGVTLSSYVQIVFQSSALKDMENYDEILFLEKKGASDSELIAQEKKLALDRNVNVLGVIVLV